MKKRWKCYVNKKSIKKWGLCIVLAIILGCMCSGGYSGIQYIREGNNHSVKKISEKNFQLDNNIEVNQGNAVYRISADQSKIIISFPEKEYIQVKICIYYFAKYRSKSEDICREFVWK